MTPSRLVGVVAALLLGVGCVAENPDTEEGTVEVPTTASERPATGTTTTSVTPTTMAPDHSVCERDGASMLVDSTCFNREWPFTVDQGTLVCDADAITFVADGQTYAVNGLARTRELGMEIEPIWKDNPEVEGTKVSIGPLIDLGLTLCD